MIYDCRSCNFKTAGGRLPTVTCGLYFFGLICLWVIAILFALKIARRAGVPTASHFHLRLIIVPLTVVVSIGGAFLIELDPPAAGMARRLA